MKFNAEDYIQELLGQSNYLPQDLEIDDREIPEAKNVLDFLLSERFIGNMLPFGLFPRQVEMLLKLNSEYCPRCTDLDYFLEKDGNISKIPVNEPLEKILDKVTPLEYGICPKCGAKKSQLFNSGELPVKTEAALCIGQRAGKSALTSMQIAYSTHKFLKVPNLQRTYNLLPSSPFTIPLVGMTFEKARQLLYNALYEYLSKGNWYKQYHAFLDDQQAAAGIKDELYFVKDTFTRYRHKNIFIAPFGPDKRKLRGNTAIGAGIDEIGWMIAGTDGGIKFDADEIYNSVNNSLMTAKESYLDLLSKGYDNLPVPINCNISSPSSKKDKICRLVEDSKKDPFMYGVHLSTWEVNPKLPFDGPTMTALRKKNEKDFWRDFGAVPPNSSNAFIPNLDLMLELINGKTNLCKIKALKHTLQGKDYLYGHLLITKTESQKPNRILALDAGATNNSFSFAVAHIKEKSERKIVVYDALAEIIPEDDCMLDFSKIYSEVIEPMIKNLNIKLVCTDQWQNLKILSDISNNKLLKCKTKQYSVKYSDFVTFRQEVLDKNIEIPKPELRSNEIESHADDDYPVCFKDLPVSHFLFQSITVVDLMGKTVAKGEKLTDDIFRATVLAHSLILKDDYKSLFKGMTFGSGGYGGGGGLGALPSGITSGTSRLAAIPTSAGNPYNR